MTAPVTPAEAKAVWDSIDKPSARKVSEKLAAAGKPVSFKTINKWRAAGWTRQETDPVVAATAALNQVVPLVTGDPTSKLEDIAPAEAAQASEDDKKPNSVITERTLRGLVLGAENLTKQLMLNIAALVLYQPEGCARSLVAVGVAVNTAADGLCKLPALREGEMKTVGAEILPPTDEDRIKAHPLRASLEAYGKAEKETAR